MSPPMARRKWFPFLGATIVAIALAAVVSAAGSSETVALVLAAVVGSAVVSASIPYAFGIVERRVTHRRDGRNGHGSDFNGTTARVEFTRFLLPPHEEKATTAKVDVTETLAAR
jgi:hypothetical protein